MATKIKPRKIVFKKEYTFETVQQTNKSFWIIDPDLLESGEGWKTNPPNKGYFEQYAYCDANDQYVLINKTIDQLQQSIADRTLSEKDVVAKAVLASEFVCVCNSRHKLIDREQKEDAIEVNNWTGKIYSRMYLVTVENNQPFQFLVLEGCRSNRSCNSFVVINRKIFNQLQIV